MPEGNEIHRWAQRHEAAFAGKRVRVDGPQGRFTDSAVIDGRKLERVMALGKHLGYDFGKDRILHVHLGLQGDFTEGSGPLPEVRGALRLRMWNAAAVKKPAGPDASKPHRWYSEDDGTDNLAPEKIAWVELRGPMDCSIYSQEMWEKLLERLGPDPLNGDGAGKFVERVAKSRKTIGELLMDQSVAAGVGNILRAELLYRARQSPFTQGREVEVRYVAVDMEGCGCADEGSDGRPSDCDDEAEGPSAQERAGAEGRGALCVPAAGAALFCVRD